LPTWTPAALSAETRPVAGTCWRLVEAQHRVSTMKLVDDLDEQDRLERLIDATKPTVPEECRHLHYLLFTPFRYGAPYPRGSRFRRAGRTLGVFYAAERDETAAAETAFHRLLFFAEAPEVPWPTTASPFTAFACRFGTDRALDLTAPPLDADAAAWSHPTDYGPCQDLADAARSADVAALRYASARDPAGGANVALLTCRAFTTDKPTNQRSWQVLMGPNGVMATRDLPARRLFFDRTAFARDPRIAALRWER